METMTYIYIYFIAVMKQWRIYCIAVYETMAQIHGDEPVTI